jgi:Bacterial capsule synthesis protein PGA_cap
MIRKILYYFLFIPFFYSIETFSQSLEIISPKEVSITFVGDLMCHIPQLDFAKTGNGSFSFDPAFQYVKKYFFVSDFTVGNLETVTAGKSNGFSGYPRFNSPDKYISALKNSGFDLLTTANNHALDQGEIGVKRTIDQITKNNINYTGTFKSQKDRDSIRIFNIKGIEIAFLAYTYGTNGIPVPKKYLINIIDTSLIRNDICKARKNGADVVLVYFHFGDEYRTYPNSFQKEIVKQAIDAGADIIIGGHPHVLQPVKFFKTKDSKLDTGFIAYSIGNFFTNQRQRYANAGIILNIELSKDAGGKSIHISRIKYCPTYVFKGETGEGMKFIIVPSEEALNSGSFNFLSWDDFSLIEQSINDTKRILTRYTYKIKSYNFKQEIIYQFRMLNPSSLARPEIFNKLQLEQIREPR